MSPKRKKPVVYLAGPVRGCNLDQRTVWRTLVKTRWQNDFDFVDPTEGENLVKDGVHHYEVVHRQEKSLAKADAVLANMWRESVGTSIGVALARANGKPVVVIDPNHINSPTLAYFADAVEPTVTQAVRVLKAMLKAQRKLQIVIKRDGSEESFDREKLVRSIRRACNDAKRSDIMAPPAIVPRTITALTESRAPVKGKVTSRAIRDAVWTVLAELEADPIRHSDFAGIREAWERFDIGRRPQVSKLSIRSTGSQVKVHPRPLNVRVHSDKSHATIWGKGVKSRNEIPAPARQLFSEICRVQGIAEIRLTRMAQGHQEPGVRAEIHASKSPGVIEGKCHTAAKKGQVQMFQIRVHNHELTDEIRRKLIEHLAEKRMLRIQVGEAA